MRVRIRRDPDAPVSRWKIMMCRLLGHQFNLVHDTTTPAARMYRECACCEMQVSPFGLETTKAQRLETSQAISKSLTDQDVSAAL